MNFYKAIIQYDGSDRWGFQDQNNFPTIQRDINLSLDKILKGAFTTRAASRTDKGVHAFGQVIKISSEDPSPITITDLHQVLPPHIRCLSISPCQKEFSPSVDQYSKEYRYVFTDQRENLEQDLRYVPKVPLSLNISHMKDCVRMIKGTNDFRNFWSIGGVSNTTIREIIDCDLVPVNPQELFKGTLFNPGPITSCWQFRIVGRGFLKHMVRHLVGALWLVGSEKLRVKEFSDLLYGEQKQQRPWKKADPQGLYLLKVNYGPE